MTLGCLVVLLSGGQAAAVDFLRDVRPILSDNCFKCHGPDVESVQSGLQLHEAKLATQPADSGVAAVVPGQPDESELVFRITSDDALIRMPPEDSGKRLTAEQIETLRTWVAEGAEYQTHWAFESVQRPDAPPVSDADWARNPIDAFVLAKLKADALAPSPIADKVTLVRRLHLDLIGLPPTVDEVDAFLADDSPDAYAKLVERLLASPHYGERWGRLWLDAARYADSDGFEKDKPRDVWFYRDYVINSLNADKPYDRFIVEQIAGDLLPEATQEQIVATGFLRNSMVNEEGGIHPEQFRMEAMFDRMDAIGKGILGLTIQCAQCHTHKFDPIAHEEYYRLFAFINDSAEGSVPVWSPEQLKTRAGIFAKVRAIEEDLKHRTPDWQERLAVWEDQVRAAQPDWQVIEIENAGDNSQRYYRRDDGSVVAAGYAPTRWTAVFTGQSDAAEIQSVRLELLTDANLPSTGPGRALDGLTALTEFSVDVQDASDPSKKSNVKFTRAVADFSNEEQRTPEVLQAGFKEPRVTGPVDWAIDGKDETAWGIDAGPALRNRDRTAIFVAEGNVAFPEGTKLTFNLRQNHGGPNSDQNQNLNLGRFRISVGGATPEGMIPLPWRAQQILDTPRAARSPSQQAELFSFWREHVPEWREANEQIATLWQSHPEGTTQLVLNRIESPRETHLLQRGDMLQPKQKVEPGVPDFLHPLAESDDPPRLRFARWLVDRQSPTAARSIVNRVWQAYFGTGIVETSEDLGTQSPPPSHPALLEWLAVELMEPTSGDTSAKHASAGAPQAWSLKHLHRLIVSSATYRQSSHVSEELYARDPYNRLLARGPRFRVDAEIVRDIALSASGLLSDKVGGPSVYPPAPRFLFDPPASYGPKYWEAKQGEDRYRRALYTFRYRSVPYPALQVFDAPNGDFACVRRSRSNTPLQALTGLNETVFMECAQALAAHVLEARDDQPERLDYAFRRVLARPPTEAERGELLRLLEQQRAHIAEGWVDTKALAGKGIDKLPDGVSPTQLAAWTTVSRVLLNLDETMTKE
ncbi:MAG: PSD1 and planctomycete cytochrome C domain-containing protein [Pirellulales bacterium]